MQNWLEILYICVVVVNIMGFILVGADKKRSVQNNDRIPEVYLFCISIFFASLGVLLGMYYFHHKTKKAYFPIGIGILFIEQVALLTLIVNKI